MKTKKLRTPKNKNKRNTLKKMQVNKNCNIEIETIDLDDYVINDNYRESNNVEVPAVIDHQTKSKNTEVTSNNCQLEITSGNLEHPQDSLIILDETGQLDVSFKELSCTDDVLNMSDKKITKVSETRKDFVDFTNIDDLNYISLEKSKKIATDENEIIVIEESFDQQIQDSDNSVIIIDDNESLKPKNKIKCKSILKAKKSTKLKNYKCLKTAVKSVPVKFLRCDAITSNRMKRNLNVSKPTVTVNQKPTEELREIVIDGSNVAFSHGHNKHFSVEGLEIVIKHFTQLGHKVTAFVPQYRVKYTESTNSQLLRKLEEDRLVVFTPSRRCLGKSITPYDDKFILDYASLKKAVVVSNDNYEDLVMEKPEWQETIKHRLLMYTWVDDVIMFPNDPLGRHGPDLVTFLRF